MNKFLIIILLIFFCFAFKGFSQDTVSFVGNTRIVLDHLSKQFQNQKKIVRMESFFDNKNIYFYNITVLYELSLAVDPIPLYYIKYKNLILIFQNDFYVVNHSKQYINNYINSIKDFLNNDIIVDKIEPFTYHSKEIPESILLDNMSYYCYSVEYENIISFNITPKPYKDPSLNYKSIK